MPSTSAVATAPRDVVAAAVVPLGDGQLRARVVQVDLGPQLREQSDGAADVGRRSSSSRRRWGPTASGAPAPGRRPRRRWSSVAGDAHAVALGLGVPVHVEEVDERLPAAASAALHLGEVDVEEVAAGGVGRVLQRVEAVVAVVDRADDPGAGPDALDGGGVVDVAPDHLGVGDRRGVHLGVRVRPEVGLVVEREQDVGAAALGLEPVDELVLVDEAVVGVRRGVSGAALRGVVLAEAGGR